MTKSFVPSRRNILAATAAGSSAAVAATARAASFGNPDEPPQGAINTQGNPASVSDPGPHDPTLHERSFPVPSRRRQPMSATCRCSGRHSTTRRGASRTAAGHARSHKTTSRFPTKFPA